MLDATSLSEEELGLLFAPASHGAGSATLNHGRKPRTAARKPPSRVSTAKRAATRTTTSATPLLTNTPFGTVLPARCGYRTGKCQNLQAIKRNGRLHKLCEFHRERANLNQKKLDRKKRMQRSERGAKRPSPPPCESVTSSEDDNASTSGSPRTVEAAAISSVFVRSEAKTVKPELDTELFLPTSLHEAPLALGCEELAIFCSLMTFDLHSHRAPPVRRHTRPRHFYSGTV